MSRLLHNFILTLIILPLYLPTGTEYALKNYAIVMKFDYEILSNMHFNLDRSLGYSDNGLHI